LSAAAGQGMRARISILSRFRDVEAAGVPAAPKLTLGRFLKVFRRYLPYLKPYWKQLVLMLLVMPLANSVLVVILPLCSKLILDVAFPRRDMQLLTILAFTGFAALFLDRTLILVRNSLYGYLRLGVLRGLAPRFYSNMLSLGMRYHQQTPVGEKIFRCDTDLIDTSEMIGTQFPFMVQFFYQFVFVLAAMLFLDWRPVAIAFAISPLIMVVGHYLYDIYRRFDLMQRVRGQTLTAQLERSLAAPAVVFSHAARRTEALRYYWAVSRYAVANLLNMFMLQVSIVFIWPSELPVILSSFVIGLCGWWVITGEMTVGEWSALSIYIVQAMVPLGILISYYQSMRLRMVAAERVLSILDLDQHMPEAPDAQDPGRLRGEIEARDIHFSYQPGKTVLRGVSFRIPAGAKVAFVGPSGSGKSTLLNLVLRFYDPDSGQVLVDGSDLRSLSLRPYRRQVGIVPQEPVIFDRTVRENILYGNADATDDDLARAARVSRLEPVIASLTAGYDTPLKQGGDLSLGQKQQVSVARCLVGDPPILLLDEPASLLDPAAQARLTETIFDAAEGRTMIFISHDLTKLAAMDRIYAMRDGRIVEEGTHDELIALRGLYHSLWKLQTEQTAGTRPAEGGDVARGGH
jgi:ABC-type multidrug transport system fused ATPase/permease subunit